MIEALSAVLPIFIYILLIVLLIVGIILGIKLIITIDKVNLVVDDISEKVSALDNLFRIVSGVSDKFNLLSSKLSDAVLGLISKIGRKRKGEEDYE